MLNVLKTEEILNRFPLRKMTIFLENDQLGLEKTLSLKLLDLNAEENLPNNLNR